MLFMINEKRRHIPLESTEEYRSDYRRDYARVLHSPSFRRLENKTQLFPGNESDFFRNRLTHSLEVAQIAKSISLKIKKDYPELATNIEPDVCEIAGLIHDLGHPPFGHNGEAALDRCMKKFGGFEGNAQTLRIITRLEKKERDDCLFDSNGTDRRFGLNLTARTIAAAIKYDRIIPLEREDNEKIVKGYYESELDIVNEVKKSLGAVNSEGNVVDSFKTIECSIMDLADDIAYSTYDIEDAFKAGFLTPYDLMSADDNILQQIVDKLSDSKIIMSVSEVRSTILGLFVDVWQKSVDDIRSISLSDGLYEEKVLSTFVTSYKYSKKMASDGFMRTQFTSFIVKRFIDGIIYHANKEYPILSEVSFDEEILKEVNILKQFAFVSLINSSKVKVSENRGQEIVDKIFLKLSLDNGYKLLPEDFQAVYHHLQSDKDRNRLISDFIAGMTDRYALEFFGRLYSENPQSIFKPF